MQPIHIAAMIGCTEILKYVASLPGVEPHAVVLLAVKHICNYLCMCTLLVYK